MVLQNGDVEAIAAMLGRAGSDLSRCWAVQRQAIAGEWAQVERLVRQFPSVCGVQAGCLAWQIRARY
jgi:hypothetical protein